MSGTHSELIGTDDGAAAAGEAGAWDDETLGAKGLPPAAARLAADAAAGGEHTSPVRRLPPSTFDMLGASVSPRREVPSPPSHNSPKH